MDYAVVAVAFTVIVAVGIAWTYAILPKSWKNKIDKVVNGFFL